MIKVSAETREMLVWIFNKFGDRTFTFNEVSDTISPSMFERFKLNKFIVKDELFQIDHPDDAEKNDGWRLNWSSVSNFVKKKKTGGK